MVGVRRSQTILRCRGRDRYVNEEFDLDLTYITERIIGELESAR